MTQAALASRMYMARTGITRIEGGQRAVTAPELAAIADVLGVDVGFLMVPGGLRASVTTTRRSSDSSQARWVQHKAWSPDLSTALWTISTHLKRLRTSPVFVRVRNVSAALMRRVQRLALEFLGAVAYQPAAKAKWKGPGFF